MRAHQDGAQRVPHAGLEVADLPAGMIDRHQGAHVVVGHRAAEGARGEVGEDLLGAGGLLGRHVRIADEDLLAARGLAHAGDLERPADLQRMHAVNAVLAALERGDPHALVAFREAAVHERDGHRVLAGGGVEPDPLQARIDRRHGVVENLVDPLVVGFAADLGAVELLAVEQRDDRVLELHARHFARQRHVADRQLVFAVGEERVLDAHAAARAERHALVVPLLGAGPVDAARRQRDDHVGDVAVGLHDRNRPRVADGVVRDGAGGVQVLIDERRRDLQGLRVVVVAVLDVVCGQQRGGVDVQAEQIADGVLVFAPVETTERDAPDVLVRGGRVDRVLEPAGHLEHGLVVGALLASRRHEAAAQLADGLLPDLRVLGDRLGAHDVERHAPRPVLEVVAAHAVILQQAPVLGRRVGSIRRLRDGGAGGEQCERRAQSGGSHHRS